MKTLITLYLFLTLSSLQAQEVEYTKSYFGADFGASMPTRILKDSYKTQGIRFSDFAMAVKGGVRIIPIGNETSGLKYLIEAELRSDNWQSTTLYGTFFSLAGGTETWIGEKGYFNVLLGASFLYKETPRPYISLRIGYGQFYLQPVIIPKVAQGFMPTMIYLTIGFKSFSYAGVRYK